MLTRACPCESRGAEERHRRGVRRGGLAALPRTHVMANLLTRVPQRALLSLSKGRRGHHLPATVSRLATSNDAAGPIPDRDGFVRRVLR